MSFSSPIGKEEKEEREEKYNRLRAQGLYEYRVYFETLNSGIESVIVNACKLDDALCKVTQENGDYLDPIFFIKAEQLGLDKISRTFKLKKEYKKLQWFRVCWRDLDSNIRDACYYIVQAFSPKEAILKTKQEIREQPLYHRILFKYISVDEQTKSKSWKEVCRNTNLGFQNKINQYHPNPDELWQYYNESHDEYSERYNSFVRTKFNEHDIFSSQLNDNTDYVGYSTPSNEEFEAFMKKSDNVEAINKPITFKQEPVIETVNEKKLRLADKIRLFVLKLSSHIKRYLTH